MIEQYNLRAPICFIKQPQNETLRLLENGGNKDKARYNL